ncbi:hypothetical protein FOVG_11193 [Fusarium oxysporum f. sp. pisi HDV247]|uniref:Uncharacterized protein n=1 Tax=Fusarium oxysporum f. sp. pisi HDV247 TaxID=1080344 RepID=W9PIQ0_FUSOX|nr:hypothetical protein FOVG_11193 [Fusarium oxysporum f. sp. pisi HDV247]
MPSKPQIEAELNRLRNDMEMLQINHDTARQELRCRELQRYRDKEREPMRDLRSAA